MAGVAVVLRHWPRATAIESLHLFCSCSGCTTSSPSALLPDPANSRLTSLFPPPLPHPHHRHPPVRRLLFSSTSFSARRVAFQGQGLRLPGPSPLKDGSSQLGDSDSDSDSGLDPDSPKKSRNQKKRESRRAVRWGMDLAKFSPPQIKRILRAASLEKEVFDALMLVKRLGPDVREGRRRQFNYIGKLLRKAPPELMDGLIQASKDGDNSKLQALSGLEADQVEDEYEEVEDTEDEDGCDNYVVTANRWLDGLIYEDLSITNEVYSIYNIEFDRQELRKLVRRVQSIRERQHDEEKEGEDDTALTRAMNSLARFLRVLAKRSVAE